MSEVKTLTAVFQNDVIKTEPNVDEITSGIAKTSVSEEVELEVKFEGGAEFEGGAAGGGATGGAAATEDSAKKIVVPKEFLGGEGNDQVEMFAVMPLDWCPHLDGVTPVPSRGLQADSPCKDCGSTAENWLCLTCYQVYCGRYVSEHMVMHSFDTGHKMVLSYADLSAWCYACDSYVHCSALSDAKRAAHISKFGEDIPGH